jgi:hypothetical protein
MDFINFIAENKSFTAEDQTKVRSFIKLYGGRIETAMINLGVLSEDEAAELMAKYLNLEYLSSDKLESISSLVSENYKIPFDLTLNEYLKKK